jgi:hypothetical protein
MTIERAKTLAVLRIEDVADLLGVHPKTVKRSRVPGRISELSRSARYRAAVVVAWLTEERGASRKNPR